MTWCASNSPLSARHSAVPYAVRFPSLRSRAVQCRSVPRAPRRNAVLRSVVTHCSAAPRSVRIASHMATSAAPMMVMPLTTPPGRSNDAAYGTRRVHSPGAQDWTTKPKGFKKGAAATSSASSCSVAFTSSTEAAGDVVFGQPLLRIGEYQIRRADFDQIAHVEIRGALRYARRLLHIVRHDDDGVIRAQFIDQILDPRARYRIQRRRGFVHQDDFGTHGDGARDAKPLLLSAGKAGA